MRLSSLLLAAMLLMPFITPASAAMRISSDRGGQIGQYLERFAMLRASGEHVVIDGNCLSACTLLLGTIPRDRVCATPRARLGFHAAWTPGADGRPVTSAAGTRALWHIYPMRVRRWINRHGGLSRHMIYMQGRALYHFIPSCRSLAQQRTARLTHRGHLRRRYASRRLHRYYSASAASDRR